MKAMNNEILAVIDVGSNSVRTLVATSDGQRIAAARDTTRLMEGVQNGILSQESIARTAEAICRQAAQAREMGAGKVAAFGTSALRDAANRESLSDLTERECGLRVQLISGETEASLAYAGASPEGVGGVVDIGGGSTELLYGRNGRVLRAESAQIGAVRLRMLLGECDAPAMLETAKNALAAQAQGFSEYPIEKWVGVGGTITTLATMTMGLPRERFLEAEDFPLTGEIARDWLFRLCGLTTQERAALPGISPVRADIIPYGAAILAAVFEITKAPRMHASHHDNLEGFIRLLAQTPDAECP